MISPYPKKTEMLMQLHYSRLLEKDRRHYAAIEALKLGRGGTSYISELLHIDRGSLIQGKKELLTQSEYKQIPVGKQRRRGGGRKKNDKIS